MDIYVKKKSEQKSLKKKNTWRDLLNCCFNLFRSIYSLFVWV